MVKPKINEDIQQLKRFANQNRFLRNSRLTNLHKSLQSFPCLFRFCYCSRTRIERILYCAFWLNLFFVHCIVLQKLKMKLQTQQTKMKELKEKRRLIKDQRSMKKRDAIWNAVKLKGKNMKKVQGSSNWTLKDLIRRFF